MSSPAEMIEQRIREGRRLAPVTTQPKPAADPLAFMSRFQMTQEQAEEISDPTWLEPGLVADGHIVAVVAKPNGGKTTVLFHLACKWAADQHRTVVFVHADTNPSDAKRMLQIAQRYGLNYLTPDFMLGQSMRNVVEELERLAQTDTDLTGHVWLFDTLKKMTNVIQKEGLRNLLGLMRKLCMKGMTCVLLAHTNKYKNADGEYQYEGTGDLEADVDELIYFEPQENPDGSLTVSTRCAKRRAEIQPMTWDIARDRTVTARSEYVDVAAQAKRAAEREQDSPVIEAITEALADGPRKQVEMIEFCSKFRQTEKRVRNVLKRYTGELWTAEKLFERNAWRYTLKANSRIPLPDCRTGRTETSSGEF